MDTKVTKLEDGTIELTLRGKPEEINQIPGLSFDVRPAAKKYYCVECSFSPSVTIYSDGEFLGLEASSACQNGSGGFYKSIKEGQC